MNPLNPAASSLNAERARVDAGPAPGAGANDAAASGGFADLLRDMGAPAKAAPAQGTAPATPQAQLQDAARAKAAAQAPLQRPREMLAPGQPDRMADSPKPRDTTPTTAKAGASRPAKAETDAADAADEASPDTPRTETRDAATASDGAAPQAPANDPPPTLAHWLLNGAARASGGDSTLLPPPAQSSDEQDAAALTRDLLQGLRSGAGKGVGERALGAVRAGSAEGGKKGAEAADSAGHAAGAWAAAHLGHDRGQEQALGRAELGIAGDKPSLAQGGAASLAGVEAGGAGAAAAAAGNPATLDLASLRPLAGEAGGPGPFVAEHPIHTPVGLAGFGEEVALSIATLNRGGVHEARLQLNPAELGPVSVHIEVVDGNARVDLGAAHAATRQLLEAALPALAEAFKADGLNLAASQVAEGWTAPSDAALGGRGFDMAGDGGRRGAQPDGAADPARGMGSAYGAPGAGSPGAGGTAGDPLWSSAARRGTGGLDLYA